MLLQKRLNLYRWIENLLWLFLIGLVGMMVFLHNKLTLGLLQIISILIIICLVVGVILLIEKFIDSYLDNIFTQISFAEGSAFSTLYNNSPVAYLTINNKNIITDYNSAAVRLLKQNINTIRGENLASLIEFDNDTTAILMSKIRSGITINDVELPMKTTTGEVIWVMMSVFSYRGGIDKMVSLIDITEKKRVDNAKSEFVALATHQLRTPIAAIRWNTELLENNLVGVTTPDRERYLDKIKRNTLRMIALINDFLSVSKLEMGTYASSPELVNLSDFLNSITDEFVEKITEKNINLTRNDNSPDTSIKIDQRLLHIIVSNLVSNAVKYLNPGGNLFLTAKIENNLLELIVADNGIGIPENEVVNLFTKFYRASNAESHQTEGTGLGLYIVKQSVELLGGEISVVTAENQGAKFIVSIPVS